MSFEAFPARRWGNRCRAGAPAFLSSGQLALRRILRRRAARYAERHHLKLVKAASRRLDLKSVRGPGDGADVRVARREAAEGENAPQHLGLRRVLASSLDAAQVEVDSRILRRGSGHATSSLSHHLVYCDAGKSPQRQILEKVLAAGGSRSSSSAYGAQEAAIYLHLAGKDELGGVTLARCYGVHYSDRQNIHLYLEYLHGCRPPKTLTDYELIARRLGEFNGWAAKEQIWKERWLKPDRGLAVRSRANALNNAIQAFFAEHEDRERLLGIVRNVAQGANKLGQIEAVTPPTLAHGDTHAGNILISEKDRRLYLIDWGKASSSRLGYDLVKVAAPWTHILGRGGKFAEYTELESFLLSEYLDGICSFLPEVERSVIERYYYLRSFVEVVRILPLIIKRYQSAPSKKHRLKLEKNRKELARFLISQGEQALSILDRTAPISPSA